MIKTFKQGAPRKNTPQLSTLTNQFVHGKILTMTNRNNNSFAMKKRYATRLQQNLTCSYTNVILLFMTKSKAEQFKQTKGTFP